MAVLSNTSDSPPWSPALSEQSTASKELDIRELHQSLPSRSDLAFMLGQLEASIQDQMSTLAKDVRHIGQRVEELEEENLTTIKAIKAIETRQSTLEKIFLHMARNQEDLERHNLSDPLLQDERRHHALDKRLSCASKGQYHYPDISRPGLDDITGPEGSPPDYPGSSRP
ncbi:Hypothetical predicted protein [Pelobates cultripes]|uniref:Uncharacterized protein n=1 Tax=Pelobates cultripes TaxID=61616 RepID=A0AAD1RYV4_PELCU|nr:Hypothetical predicted protein [Pelobates cultripes]